MTTWVICLKRVCWILFFILLSIPIVVDFVFIDELYSFAQGVFPYWSYATLNVFFKDVLFIEAAVLLFFGALVGGVTLYTAWAPRDVRKAQFTEYIWNWKKMKDERDTLTGLWVGLALIAFGIIYVLVAVFF
jgi:hypothetical protein